MSLVNMYAKELNDISRNKYTARDIETLRNVISEGRLFYLHLRGLAKHIAKKDVEDLAYYLRQAIQESYR